MSEIVAAAFADREHADQAVAALAAGGVSAGDIQVGSTSGTDSGGGPEASDTRYLVRRAVLWAVIGAVVGIAVAVGLIALFGNTRHPAWVGAIIGGFWVGAVLGAFYGVGIGLLRSGQWTRYQRDHRTEICVAVAVSESSPAQAVTEMLQTSGGASVQQLRTTTRQTNSA